ncbi:MAG: DNA translocase FtsK 4TM domain-containing protein [Burkholderiales bacterium]|nr:DNA translocase FtsK 4TM domain-containing protein [Bacteroidia bacterium]
MAKKSKENKVIFEDIKEFPEKDSAVEKSKPKQPEKGSAQEKKIFKFIADERFLRSVGILFVLFALFLFIASISFFATWQSDQSLVKSISWGMLTQTNPGVADNLLGMLGAWLSYVFIYKGFGIAAFAFVLIFFSVGVLLMTNLQPIPIVKTLRYSFFAGIWISLSMGFLFADNYPVLAGSFGYFGFLYLKGLLGVLGTGLLLLSYALIFMVVIFNLRFYEPKVINEPLKDSHDTDTNNIDGLITMSSQVNETTELNPDEFLLIQKKEVPEEIISTLEEEIIPGSDTINEGNEEVKIIEEINIPVAEEFIEPALIEPAATLKTDSGLVLVVQGTVEEDVPLPNIETERKSHYTIDEPYDPTLDFSNYQYPTIDLLNDYGDNKGKVESAELSEKTRMIEDTLKNYGIGIKSISATIGPTVTLYEIIPQDGVRIAKIKNLEDDIALSLAALGIRIIAPIPGRGTIGIEVPNSKPAIVSMRSVLSSPKFINAEMDLPIAFGKTISNEIFVTDLAKMPHLLMAGATGQGKSVGLNAVLASLLYKKHPSQIKFVLVDPKKVELNIYKTIERHFLAKIPGDQDAIITDTKLVVHTLNSLCKEMDDRYDLLKDAQVRNLKEYNAKFISRRLPPTDKIAHRYLPYIVVVIDELADLMMTAGKEVEHPIARLAQLARAIGIHLILATQRPSVNIITGTIKANFPARIAFRVSQKIDSRTILDANGADQLIGKGDMLFSNGNDLIRLQCAFVDTPEVEKITEFIGNQQGREPYLLPLVQTENDEMISGEGFDGSNKDDLFEEAARIIVVHQQGSTSLLQRRLNLGYNRAGRLIDQLEKAGVVGPFKGSKAREVLMHTEAELDEWLKGMK